MLRTISAQELDDRWRLELVDPYGQLRDDIRIAHQTAHIASIMGVKRKDGKAFTADDFLLRFDMAPKQKQQTAEQIERIFMQWAKAHNKAWQERQSQPD